MGDKHWVLVTYPTSGITIRDNHWVMVVVTGDYSTFVMPIEDKYGIVETSSTPGITMGD